MYWIIGPAAIWLIYTTYTVVDDGRIIVYVNKDTAVSADKNTILGIDKIVSVTVDHPTFILDKETLCYINSDRSA